MAGVLMVRALRERRSTWTGCEAPEAGIQRLQHEPGGICRFVTAVAQ
ncbi:MAG: hypothetical protein ACKOSS_03485 [Planctomycetia bacterium]